MAEERPIDRDLAREPSGDSPVAAPPDDGGHVGDFTVPSDVMQVGGPDHERGPTPPTHRDPTRTGAMDRMDRQDPQRGVGVATGTLVIIALVALAVAIVIFVAGS